MVACLCAYGNLQPNCFARGTLEWRQRARPIGHDNLTIDQQAIMNRLCFGLTSGATLQPSHGLGFGKSNPDIIWIFAVEDTSRQIGIHHRWEPNPAETHVADETPLQLP
jgi:hypothetical protein